MKVFLCLILLGGIAASAECPSTVTCPSDGDQMTNTYDCKGIGETRTCKFSHTATVYDDDGSSHQVTHSLWVSCAD
jgi:hypothetical protein